MGKRSTFPRIERDCYDTPPEAVAPLIPHLPFLPNGVSYWEPCAGNGQLIMALKEFWKVGYCVLASDIEPRHHTIFKIDALEFSGAEQADYIITNPPWARSILHPMIDRFSDMRPTWLLFDADWMHTKQSSPFMWRCQKIVSVGRVKWMKDSPHTGKDNCCWYLFDAKNTQRTQFFGRQDGQ